jgi:hypothetical protein
MPRTPARVSYANVTSTLALVVALGAGGAYAANTVRSKDIVDGEVKAADLGRGAVTARALKNGTVGSKQVTDGAIATVDLAANAVDSAAIGAGQVRTEDLGTSAVDSFNIRDGGVQGPDIGPSSVNGQKLQDGSVANADLGNSSVNSIKVQDNTLTLADLVGGDATVTVTISNLASARCSQPTASVPGALAGQVGVVSTVGTVPVGWDVTALRVNAGQVVLSFCNLTGAVASLTSQQFRVVTLG